MGLALPGDVVDVAGGPHFNVGFLGDAVFGSIDEAHHVVEPSFGDDAAGEGAVDHHELVLFAGVGDGGCLLGKLYVEGGDLVHDGAAVDDDEGLHDLRVFEGEPDDGVAAAGVAHEVGLLQVNGLHEVVEVLDGRAEDIVRGVFGVVGVALAYLVDGEDVEVSGQAVEVEVPVGGAVEAAELSAVDEQDGFALTGLEVASGDAVHVDELGVLHVESSALG